MTCRNSEANIEQALISIKSQSVKPGYVIVVDDGSTDGTSQILRKVKAEWDALHIITNPDLGYDISRVVRNWNKAIAYARESKLQETDYHMISADDIVYEEHYAETIIHHMDKDPTIAIASGDYGNGATKTPHGAGRFVRNSFFTQRYGLYPERMGYESLVLYEAVRCNYTYKVFDDARFKHIRELGKNHHFYEFGASMRTLGYHPLFVLGRFLVYLATGKPIGRIGAFYMLYHYLFYKSKTEGYDSMHDATIRKFIRQKQIERIKRLLKIQQPLTNS